MPNPKKSSKIPFLLVALIFLVLALIFLVLFIFYAHSGDYTDSSNNTVTYSGQTYKTVQIDEQIWMAENLNYDAEGSVCYESNPDNCAKYGRLYNWETALKVCPDGWHLPNIREWDKLFRFVDGNTGLETGYLSRTAGEFLKATSGWNYEGNGTDAYGFSALPGGRCYSDDGSFDVVGYYGYWWSASENEYADEYEIYRHLAYGRRIDYDSKSIIWISSSKSELFSVRCLRD